MKKNIISFLLMAFAMSLAVSSCIKDDVAELGTAGTPRIKLLEAPQRSLFFSPFTEVRNIDLFSLRRDEVSSAGIDQAITVKVLADTAGVTAYNEEHGTT